MDQNRLNLNLLRSQQNNAGEGFADRSYPASDGRVYPTTPSTFPHSVFQQSMQGNQDYLTSPTQSSTGQGYFANAQHQQYNQQPHYGNQPYQQQGVTNPSAYSSRNMQANDPNSDLARQFSGQSLGAQSRQAAYGRPSPLSGGRSGSDRGQQGYGGHLTPHNASAGYLPPSGDEKPPEQDPNKYSQNIGQKVIGLHLYVEKFFKENINRARERNVRSVE